MLCLILHLNVVSFPTAGKHAGTANKHCMLEFKSIISIRIGRVSDSCCPAVVFEFVIVEEFTVETEVLSIFPRAT